MHTRAKWDLALFTAVILICCVLMIGLVISAPSDARMTIDQFAQQQTISPAEYPDSLIRLLERNPETEEFVLNYPFHQEMEIDLSDCDRSSVPLLLQWDPRWGYMEYGSDMVAITGCGPVCLAMVGYYLTGDAKFHPDQVVTFALEQDYYSPGHGSKWTLISEGAKQLGLNVKELAPEEKKVAAYLRAGDPVIASMGPGDFTSSGHFIVLTGYRDGMVSVNDPNSRLRSEKEWEFAAIRDQIRNLWVFLAEE